MSLSAGWPWGKGPANSIKSALIDAAIWTAAFTPIVNLFVPAIEVLCYAGENFVYLLCCGLGGNMNLQVNVNTWGQAVILSNRRWRRI